MFLFQADTAFVIYFLWAWVCWNPADLPPALLLWQEIGPGAQQGGEGRWGVCPGVSALPKLGLTTIDSLASLWQPLVSPYLGCGEESDKG